MSEHWANLSERSFVYGMRFLFLIYRMFGRTAFRFILYPVVLFYVLTSPLARRSSQAYLKNLNKPTSLVFLHFIHFAESILDKMLVWGKLYSFKNTRFVGDELIVENIKQQQGGIFITAHLGNLELCRALAEKRSGLKITVLTHTKHALVFNKLLAELNPHSQLNLLQVTDFSPATALILQEKVQRGEFIVIVGDRIPVSVKPRTVTAPFLGKPAAFPIGPYILANLLQCPTYLLFSFKYQEHTHIHIELLRQRIVIPRNQREHYLTTLATHYAERLEYYCKQAPLQWFNFYDFWHRPATEI